MGTYAIVGFFVAQCYGVPILAGAAYGILFYGVKYFLLPYLTKIVKPPVENLGKTSGFTVGGNHSNPVFGQLHNDNYEKSLYIINCIYIFQ